MAASALQTQSHIGLSSELLGDADEAACESRGVYRQDADIAPNVSSLLSTRYDLPHLRPQTAACPAFECCKQKRHSLEEDVCV